MTTTKVQNKTPIDDYVLEQIPGLRAQGLSFRAIAAKLNIGETTVRKHQNFKLQNKKPLSEYAFTDRQLEIAIKAAEKNARK